MYRGTFTALVTPFRNGSLDEDAFRRLVDAQFENGVTGIVPVGTTGESPTLSYEEHKAVIRLAVECERRYADGSLDRPEAIESIPWENRDLDWLASSLGYLRSVVPTLIESARVPSATSAAPSTTPEAPSR